MDAGTRAMQGVIAGSFAFVAHGVQLSQPKGQPTKKFNI